MVEVAETSGVPLRTLYRQFPGRDELLLALLEEEARLGVEMLTRSIDDAADPTTRLHAFVVGLLDFMRRGSGYASILVREHLRLAEEHPDEARASLEPFVGLMVDLMEEADGAVGRRRGPSRTTSADAFVMFSVLLAHIQAVLLFRPDLDGEETARTVWVQFLAVSAVNPADPPGRAGIGTKQGSRRQQSRKGNR